MSEIALLRLNFTSWFALGLTAVALQTAVRIELLNHDAGGLLPRRPGEDGHVSKWRHLPWTAPGMWQQMFGPRDANGLPVNRPLTDEESKAINAGIERTIRRNQLRDVVSTWGVAQYFVIPLLMMLATANLLRSDPDSIVRRSSRVGRIGAGIILAIGIALTAIMLYHGYLASLGW